MNSWISQNRVVTAYPGPRDSCVVTLVDGKRIGLCSVEEYDAALPLANQFAGNEAGLEGAAYDRR